MGRINVLSLFNGMSFGMMALETCGIEVDKYYSSEIDKYANQATKALYPDIIQLGDVTKWDDWDIDLGEIDLLIAGFPCQAWSIAGKQQGDNDPRGALVHDLIAIWEEINITRELIGEEPVKFMFENVKMKKEFLDYINELFGVDPVCINSALVSAQNRVRYYWTNIGDIEQPKDKGVVLDDIIDANACEPNSDGWQEWWKKNSEFQLKKKYSAVCNDGSTDKAICLTARQYASWNGNFAIIQTPRGNNPGGIRAESGKTPCLSANCWQHNNHLTNGVKYRKLTVRENARLQTVPESKIDALLKSTVSNSQLYKMLGNGWTHDVIVHIFKGLLL